MYIGCNVEIGYSVQGLVAKVKDTVANANVWGTPAILTAFFINENHVFLIAFCNVCTNETFCLWQAMMWYSKMADNV